MPSTSDYQGTPLEFFAPNFYESDPALGALLRRVRVRATAAQVNAGLDVVPARPGFKYSLVDVLVVAAGGAPAGATSVDVTARLAGASRKLFSCTIGVNFTQSKAMVPDGVGSVLLADGASFTTNDTGSAIRLEKTGAALTGATHIDVIATYGVES